MLKLNRRQFSAALASTLGIAPFARPVLAQDGQGVIMLAFPGGTSAAWQTYYVDPFVAETGVDAKIVEMTDPIGWYMGRNEEFNCSIANPVDYTLYEQGLIEPVNVADFPVMQDIPEIYWTPVADGQVLGMPVYQQVYGIAINTDYVEEDEITSWMDLTKSDYKGKVAVGGFADIYEVPWFSKLAGGSEADIEAGLDMYAKVMDNALTVPGSMSQMLQLLERGDVTVAPLYSARAWSSIKSGDSKLKLIFPKEGVPLIPYHLEMSKNGPDLEAAKQFLAFAGSAGPSKKVASEIGYFPVNEKAAFPEDIEEVFGITAEQYREALRPMDYVTIGKNRLELRDRVDQIHANMGR